MKSVKTVIKRKKGLLSFNQRGTRMESWTSVEKILICNYNLSCVDRISILERISIKILIKKNYTRNRMYRTFIHTRVRLKSMFYVEIYLHFN